MFLILRSASEGCISKDARHGIALGAALAGCCILAAPASAHGFGQRYDLPLPLSLYLMGTAAAVVVSFVIVGLFVREVPKAQAYPHADLSATLLGRLIAHPGL